MKKKNLLIIGSSKGVYGGIEAFMMAVAEAAEHWGEFDVKLCFKLLKNAEADENLSSMASMVCKSVQFVNRGSKELFQLIKWADILHVQNMPPDIVIPAYFYRKKIMLTVHNRRLSKSSLNNYIWGLTIKLADKRWFNSNFVWNTWEPGEKDKNSGCVPTVCNLSEESILPEYRKGFLFVGRWIKNKGIEEIIEAYKICGLDYNEWPLTILGDGPIKDKVHSLINLHGLENVILPGFVDDKSKQKFIASAKWLLAPAKTQEDLGLTPIEARSLGVPSIVTRDGGLPEAGGPSAIIAEAGNVGDLVRCMKLAVNMSAEEYNHRCLIGKEELKSFLKPITFYRYEFQN